MAGDWIKMRSDLGMDPAVIRMSLATSLDPFGVVGRLHALWAWADAHTTNGLVSGVTSEWIDTFVRCPGFAEAMCGAGWLSQRPGGVEFPRFDRHMGDGAKARAQKTKRQQKWRGAGATPPKPPRVRPVDAGVDGVASTERLPEKRREEKKTEEEPLAAKPPQKARKPNPLFDALAEVTASDPSLNGGQIGKTASALSRAEPPYTPDEVREFGRRYLEFCSWASGQRDRPTIGEVEKYISRLRAGPGTAIPVAPQKGFRTRTDELYEHLEL